MKNLCTLPTLLFLALLLFAGLPGEAGAQITTGSEPDGTTDSTMALDTAMQQEAWRVGIYIGLNRSIYSADNLQGMPGVPNCCPGFNSGGGLGLAVGAIAETPLNDWLNFGGRFYVNTYNGALIHEESEIVDDEGFATEAIFEHRIDADIWAVSIEPVLLFDIDENAKLFTGLRGDVIVRKLFEQKETILQPSTIVYENGTTSRLEFDGQIPNGTSFQGAIVLGARYDFYIDSDDEWVISPEISGWYSPTPVIENESWKIHGLRVALIAQHLHYDQEEKALEEVPPPAGTPEKDVSLDEDPILPARETETVSSKSGDTE